MSIDVTYRGPAGPTGLGKTVEIYAQRFRICIASCTASSVSVTPSSSSSPFEAFAVTAAVQQVVRISTAKCPCWNVCHSLTLALLWASPRIVGKEETYINPAQEW